MPKKNTESHNIIPKQEPNLNFFKPEIEELIHYVKLHLAHPQPFTATRIDIQLQLLDKVGISHSCENCKEGL